MAGLLNRPANGHTARLLGTAGATSVTSFADASALFSNPAGLTVVRSNSVTIGGALMRTRFDYDQHALLGGRSLLAEREAYLLPNVAQAFRLGSAVFGIGFNVPYALGADYSRDLPFKGKISVLAISVGVGYRARGLSVGGAAKFLRADINLTSPLLFGTEVVGKTASNAKGWGLGMAFGVIYDNAGWSLGAVFEPKTEIAVSGRTTFPPVIGIIDDQMESRFYVPSRFGLGATRSLASGKIKASAALLATDYTSNDTMIVKYDHLPASPVALNWGQVYSIHVGMEFSPSQDLALRFGTGWMTAGAPLSSPPSIPDASGWVIGAGAGMKFGRNTLDFGVGYAKAERDIPFALAYPAAGGHKLIVPMISLSVTIPFR